MQMSFLVIRVCLDAFTFVFRIVKNSFDSSFWDSFLETFMVHAMLIDDVPKRFLLLVRPMRGVSDLQLLDFFRTILRCAIYNRPNLCCNLPATSRSNELRDSCIVRSKLFHTDHKSLLL